MFKNYVHPLTKKWDNFSSFCPLETRNSVFWSLWVSATFVFKFMKKYFQKIFFRAQNILGSIFHNSILNLFFPNFFHTKFSKNHHLKKIQKLKFRVFSKNIEISIFWFFQMMIFWKLCVKKNWKKKVQNRVMKNAIQNVLCSKKYFLSIFFHGIKSKSCAYP